jgi:predicted RNA-binding protein Jag
VLAGDAEAITLSDMNSYERHVAHSAIKVIEGVSSRSVGDRREKIVEVYAD